MTTIDTKKKSTSLRINSNLFAHIEKLAKKEIQERENLFKKILQHRGTISRCRK